MSLHSISTRNTHTIPSHTAFNPSTALHTRRGSLSDFSTRITIASVPNSGLFEKLSDLWLKVRIYFRSLFTLPSTPRTEVVALSQEVARFKTRIEQCPVNNLPMKVQLEQDFQRLPASVRDRFTHLSSDVLLQFARESDPQKARRIQQRALGEMDYMLTLYPKLNFLTGIRARSHNPVPPPEPNPGPNPGPNPLAGTPFANRRERVAEEANEPNELLINRISDLQKQRAREIGAMKLLIPNTYRAPGDTEDLADKYVCAIKQVEGPLDMPTFHVGARQADHHFEIDSMRTMLANFPRLRNCAVCRSPLSEAAVYVDIAMQKEIATKLSVAVAAITDANLAARLPQIVNELAQEAITLPNGTIRNRTRGEAKSLIVTKILDLPDNQFTRVSNLYMQHVHNAA